MRDDHLYEETKMLYEEIERIDGLYNILKISRALSAENTLKERYKIKIIDTTPMKDKRAFLASYKNNRSFLKVNIEEITKIEGLSYKIPLSCLWCNSGCSSCGGCHSCGGCSSGCSGCNS
ncbi:MAG: hypothetical protein J7K83_01970, partial [Candidatus Aenigmarchaeota archaeon]|nr:hypothetical protein [Candidatus Aenigmarchaeota archaeon]